MSTDNIKRKKNIWHNAYLILLFIVASFLIYLAIPDAFRFGYEFQKGRPWMHETLIAPFDFAILRTDNEIKNEEDSILKSIPPYFELNDSIGHSQLLKLKKNIHNAVREEFGEKGKYLITQNKATEIEKEIIPTFSEIFNKGVLEQSVSGYPELANRDILVVLKDNIGQYIKTDDIYSLKSAYTHISKQMQNIVNDNPGWESVLSRLNSENILKANLFYDKETTEREIASQLEKISYTRGMIQEGERIVSKGDLVSPKTNQLLESLRATFEKGYGNSGNYYIVAIGKALFTFILLIVFFLFLFNTRRDIVRSKRNITFITFTMVAMIFLCRIIHNTNTLHVHLVPFSMLALLMRTFFDTRLAIFTNTVTALIVGFMVPNGYEFALLQFFAGSIAVISHASMQRRGQLAITSLLIFLTYSTTYISLSLIQEGSFKNIEWIHMSWFLGNSVLTLITYLLVYIFEKSFGFVSDVTLIELSYSNQKLLRKLAESAPGTFQHSIQVANIAEDAITKLGGNSLLVRAGAMYHDIGKTKTPHFFTENQSGDMNPHDGLPFEESARIITGHVNEGVKLAQKNKIPEQIIDFIRTHHGTTKTGYFYLMSQKKNSGEKIPEEVFTYPGPIPTTKETAVMMLADSVEAASRSLKEKNKESLKTLIDNIFESKIKDGQLAHAPITFQDISNLKNIFLNKLFSIYHVRVEYPKEKKK